MFGIFDARLSNVSHITSNLSQTPRYVFQSQCEHLQKKGRKNKPSWIRAQCVPFGTFSLRLIYYTFRE